MFRNMSVAVAGSRSLSSSQSLLVGRVVTGLVEHGCFISVGCATGADKSAIQTLSPTQGQVFASFGPGGQGACRWSAVSAVARFSAKGGEVAWWSGGPPSLPLAARLSARTQAVAGAATALVAFFGSSAARGTRLACRVAVSRGVPVVVYPLGFPGTTLPSVGAGRWVPLSSQGLWSGAWTWEESQAVLL